MKNTFLMTIVFLMLVGCINASGSNGFNDFAIIINGGGDLSKNHERYWNDCSAIYKLLTNDYNYPSDHIYTIMADGANSANDMTLVGGGYGSSSVDFDNDGINDIVYSANKTNISFVFNMLQDSLTAYSNLFVYITGPGIRIDSSSYVTLWNNQLMSAYELNQELNKITANAINIVLQQDYCGGFINMITGLYRTVTSACQADSTASVLPDNSCSEFTYYWTLAAKKDNGNNDEDIGKTLEEIFDETIRSGACADLHDECKYEGGTGGMNGLFTISSFSVFGSKRICNSEIFFTRNLAFDESITWNISNNAASIVSGQGTNCVTIEKNYSDTCTITATISKPGIVPETINSFSESHKILVGTPPVGMLINFRAANGNYGVWASNMVSNTFSLESDFTWAYNRVEAELYSLPDNHLVESWNNINVSNHSIIGKPVGWYMFKVRGYGNCGYSPWLSQIVEMKELSSGPVFLMSYNSKTEVLSINIEEVKNSFGYPEEYEIQLRRCYDNSMSKSFKTSLKLSQISLINYPAGVYIVSVMKNGRATTQKFIKE